MTGYWLICLSLSNKFVVIPASSLGEIAMLRIAVCDDSRTDVEMLEAAFDELPDYPVEYDVYFKGKELLMCSMQDKENYHLYIFDIEMPDMNGLELAKEVRKRDAKALFVFLTSYTKYVMEVFEVITFDYISKPITFEKIESVLLKAMNYLNMIKQDFVFQFRKNHFFVVALCSFIRGNVLYLLSKFISKRGVRLSKIPKEIITVLVMVFVFAVLNCCFIIILSLESGNLKSFIMCISILVSIVLTYYFMLYMMERFNYLMRKQYEDEMYREEMFYKEIYYNEVEKRNECVQHLRHDLKNKLLELYHLAKKGDSKALVEQMGGLCQELGKIDERIYTDNPIVDSVLRIKFGLAKSEGIRDRYCYPYFQAGAA